MKNDAQENYLDWHSYPYMYMFFATISDDANITSGSMCRRYHRYAEEALVAATIHVECGAGDVPLAITRRSGVDANTPLMFFQAPFPGEIHD